MKLRPLVFLSAVLFSGCTSTQPTPSSNTRLNRSNVGGAFAEYSLEKADQNGDKVINRKEWVTAGGNEKNFSSIDTDQDGVLTLEEIKTASSTDKFFLFAKKTMDTGGNTEFTPVAFRSPAGAKLFSFEF